MVGQVTPRSIWRGWMPAQGGKPPTVTSSRLDAGTPVQSRMFPKTRSWFALGAPVELMSPLSVLRIVIPLAALLWTVEASVVSGRSGTMVATSIPVGIAVAIWVVLLQQKTVPERWCHVLTLAGAALSISVVATSGSPALAVSVVPVLLLFLVTDALFFDARWILVHDLLGFAGTGIALDHVAGVRLAVGMTVTLCFGTLVASLTIRALVIAVWRRRSIDPDIGIPNGIGLADQIARLAKLVPADRAGDSALLMAVVHLAGVDEAREALGYAVGTELLRRSVENLGQVLPPDAVITRVDGDELVVARRVESPAPPDVGWGMPSAIEEHGRALATTLAEAVQSGHYFVDRIEVTLRAHVGLAFAPWAEVDVADLVRRASLSAQRAMKNGMLAEVWDGRYGTLTAEDLAVLADLRLAGERHELSLAYQPQLTSSPLALVGVEALMRWQSPVHGRVRPDRFITLAERTGLIEKLTQWAFSEALDAQQRWSASGIDLPVSVNLSAQSLTWPGLAGWITTMLSDRGLDPASLTVEITETAEALHLVQAVENLRPLRDEGVQISIDDFGTGYTSLAVIPQLPLDEIKVDMAFVRRATRSRADEAIVRSVYELAHRLGIRTVAEGVENEETRVLMTAIGIDVLQGYLFSEPLTEADLLRNYFSGTSGAAVSQAAVSPT
jgi:EAL domain-containing protein (putative c-di-GMP-specific phosphodiesterase class I)/GGDEF domain-containing protein